MIYDVIIIGAGPAGISAALTLRAQNRSVLMISSNSKDSGLFKAKRIDNYPGMPGVSGKELLSRFERQLSDSGTEIKRGVVSGAAKCKDGFIVSAASDIFTSKTVIAAIGSAAPQLYGGESEFIGRGVSYCAVCDGAFYKSKNVALIPVISDFDEDLQILNRFGCNVFVIDPKAKQIKLLGEQKLNAVSVDGQTVPVDCVFILRPAIAPNILMPELELDGGVIKIDKACNTNIPGVFAAGDCTGAPLQISKAAGEGLIAAFSANKFLNIR